MSFLGSQYMSSGMGGFSGGMGYGGMNSMYGGGYPGGMMNDPQGVMQNGQMQGAPNEYQFDLRRDIHATIGIETSTNYVFIGGLNASLGLAYGVTQMFRLSEIGIRQ